MTVRLSCEQCAFVAACARAIPVDVARRDDGSLFLDAVGQPPGRRVATLWPSQLGVLATDQLDAPDMIGDWLVGTSWRTGLARQVLPLGSAGLRDPDSSLIVRAADRWRVSSSGSLTASGFEVIAAGEPWIGLHATSRRLSEGDLIDSRDASGVTVGRRPYFYDARTPGAFIAAQAQAMFSCLREVAAGRDPGQPTVYVTFANGPSGAGLYRSANVASHQSRSLTAVSRIWQGPDPAFFTSDHIDWSLSMVGASQPDSGEATLMSEMVENWSDRVAEIRGRGRVEMHRWMTAAV